MDLEVLIFYPCLASWLPRYMQKVFQVMPNNLQIAQMWHLTHFVCPGTVVTYNSLHINYNQMQRQGFVSTTNYMKSILTETVQELNIVPSTLYLCTHPPLYVTLFSKNPYTIVKLSLVPCASLAFNFQREASRGLIATIDSHFRHLDHIEF